MIYGARVRQARELQGYTQTRLAQEAGVKQPAIAQIESGATQPSESVLERIAMATRFPPSFFRREPGPDFPLGSLLFRARRSMTAKQRTAAHRHGELLYEITVALAGRLDITPHRVPRLDADTDPEEAAAITRSAFGLPPDRPIPNLIMAAERAGTFVLPLPVEAHREDAYSTWAGTRHEYPIIGLLRGASGDRLRSNVAHEIGHLVMHHVPQGDRGERQADQFASALLLPADAIRDEFIAPVTLTNLAPLKARWGVALQRLITRARDVDVISERQRTYLFQQLSKRGWRKNEPGHVPIEHPRALRKMVQLLYGTPPAWRQLATDVGVPAAFLREAISATETIAGDPAPVHHLRDPGRAAGT